MKKGFDMTNAEKLDWIHFAIQEAMNNNPDELYTALELLEDLRELETNRES